MAVFGGTVLHTNLTTEEEAKLQEALMPCFVRLPIRFCH